MKKQKKLEAPVNVPKGTTISHCNIHSNHPPLPTEHISAVIAIAAACEQTARTLAVVAQALQWPANNSVGLKIEG